MLNGERNSFQDELGAFTAVEDFSVFGGFSCSDQDLDDFIRDDAENQQKRLLSVTYSYRLQLDNGYSDPVAFASLANDSLKLESDGKDLFLLTDIAYKDFPAVKICRLGVDSGFQGMGLGTHLMNIIKMLFLTNNRTGCRFITVDAYNNPKTIKYYISNDFQFYREKDAHRHTRIMFCDLMRFQTGRA